jgi:hypothetical protein
LAAELGASRMTVRNALLELELEGVIEHGQRGRTIVSRNPAPSTPKGRIVFLSSGVDWIVIPAWNRLWMRLSEMGRAAGWTCELKLFGNGEPFSAEGLRDDDFIVLSSIYASQMEDFLEYIKGRPRVIGVHEKHVGCLPHIVALDNRAAGRLAAKILLDAGYRKPAILRQDNQDPCFPLRGEGFLSEVAGRLPGYSPLRFEFDSRIQEKYVLACVRHLDEMKAADSDSMFVATDELIGLVYMPFSHARRIPDEFGLVTLAGSHESLVHQPRITAVSHASSKVAAAVLRLLEGMRDGSIAEDAASVELIEPGVHPGSTIRKNKEIEL